MTLAVRPVRDRCELVIAFDLAGACQDPPMDSSDWQYDAVRDGFARAQDVNLVATVKGELTGAALSFRDEGGVRIRLLGVDVRHRGNGVGRALLAGVESAGIRAGDGRVYLGSLPAGVGFYRRCGYGVAGDADGDVIVFEKLLSLA